MKVSAPRGIVGSELVASTEQKGQAKTVLHLNKEGEALCKVKEIVFETKKELRAVNAFGCALTHRKLWKAIVRRRIPLKGEGPQYVALFEDDVYSIYEAEVFQEMLRSLFQQLAASPDPPDVICMYCISRNVHSNANYGDSASFSRLEEEWQHALVSGADQKCVWLPGIVDDKESSKDSSGFQQRAKCLHVYERWCHSKGVRRGQDSVGSLRQRCFQKTQIFGTFPCSFKGGSRLGQL